MPPRRVRRAVENELALTAKLRADNFAMLDGIESVSVLTGRGCRASARRRPQPRRPQAGARVDAAVESLAGFGLRRPDREAGVRA